MQLKFPKTAIVSSACLILSLLAATPANAKSPDTAIELRCDGTLYVNTKSGQMQYQIDISVSLDPSKGSIKVDGRGFFSPDHMITKSTPQKYYIISNADYAYHKGSGYKDSDGDGYTWTSTLDRTSGYLVLIEGPIDGDRNAFNGTCAQAKPIF
jgi:hypothetical protein